MTRVVAGEIEIEYETTGQGEPLVLIMGLGGQLTDWPQELVDLLAKHFRVITFDNRDIGLSTYSDAGTPSRWQLIKANLRPRSVQPPYELAQMADDVAALLDVLNIDAAHVVGMSMGGMIAQSLTIRHPQRVLSLCSVMSNPGDRRSGRPAPKVIFRLMRRGEPSRDEILDLTVDFFRLIGGADWDEADQRRRSAASLERAYNPGGVLRQSLAITTAPDRTQALHAVRQPTLVVHGLDDNLVRHSGGIATAQAIAHSRLLLFPRMGHDLPATRHREIVDAICSNADLATALPADDPVASVG